GTAHASDFPLVCEYQPVPHPRPGAELAVLRLQRLQEPEDVGFRQLGECEIVSRRVADDARHPVRRAVAVDTVWRSRGGDRRGEGDTGVIVVEHEHATVLLVALAGAARVAGTEVAVGNVRR